MLNMAHSHLHHVPPWWHHAFWTGMVMWKKSFPAKKASTQVRQMCQVSPRVKTFCFREIIQGCEIAFGISIVIGRWVKLFWHKQSWEIKSMYSHNQQFWAPGQAAQNAPCPLSPSHFAPSSLFVVVVLAISIFWVPWREALGSPPQLLLWFPVRGRRNMVAWPALIYRRSVDCVQTDPICVQPCMCIVLSTRLGDLPAYSLCRHRIYSKQFT